MPHLDAALTSYSLVASWWGARKHIANWWLWIVVDLVYIGEYIYKDLWLTALLYAVLSVSPSSACATGAAPQKLCPIRCPLPFQSCFYIAA